MGSAATTTVGRMLTNLWCLITNDEGRNARNFFPGADSNYDVTKAESILESGVCEGLSVSDAHLPADAIYFIRFSTGDHAQEIID